MSRRCGASRHPTAKQKGGWSPEEDALLISLVKKHGEGQWSPISRALNEAMNKTDSTGRIGKQCRERWNHHLCPGLRKGPWTPEEEAMVVDAHRRLGNRWSDIARCISGRSENAVKNHWNATLRKRITAENPAGPLKEYLDTLHLTVAPRRRNGGGGGGGSGRSGSKRKRGSRECDDITSEESDESSGDDMDGEKPLAIITAPPSHSGPETPGGTGTALAASKRPARFLKTAAVGVAGRVATAAIACESAGGSATTTTTTTTTRGTVTQRFPSEVGTSVPTEAAILPRAQGAAAGGEPAPARSASVSAAAVAPSLGRRRSERVAAQVGNERLRNLVEGEQREAAAKPLTSAEMAAVIMALPETESDFDKVFKARPARFKKRSSRDVSEVTHSMKRTTESAPRVAALSQGAGGLLHSRSSNTEITSESGLPLPENALGASRSVEEPRIGSVNGPACIRTAVAPDVIVDPAAPRVAAVVAQVGTQAAPCALRSVSAAASPEDAVAAPELSFEPTAVHAGAPVRPISPVTAAVSLAVEDCVPETRGFVGGGPVHAAGWPPPLWRAHNWSTNNMQMLAAGQQPHRSSYGVSMGGKVRPPGCALAEDYGSTGLLSAHAADAATSGDAIAGSTCPTTAAAAAADFAARGCPKDDAFLMVDLPGDVASGSDIFDLVPRPRPELTAITAPPSPAETHAAAAAAAAPWESLSPVTEAVAAPPCPMNPGCIWSIRMPQGGLQGPIPPDLLEAPDPGLVPGALICSDSPLHHGGAVALPEAAKVEQQARPNGNVATRSSGAGMTAAPILCQYNTSGHFEVGALTTLESVQQVHGLDPFGYFGGDDGGGYGGIAGVAANSSITSVGSPLSELCYEYGDSGTHLGGEADGARLHSGMAAGAATASHGAATACGQDDGEGQLARTTVAGHTLKRESSISGCCAMMSAQSLHQGTQLMAPFKVAAPQAMGPMGEAQPVSPWTPAGASCLAAPLPQTMPAAPASPIPWGVVQVPPTHAGHTHTACAPMQVPYVLTPGHATALPHMAGLPAPPALPHTPPIICYGMSPLPPPLHSHVATPATLSQQPPTPHPATQPLYSGTQVLGRGQIQQYPPHALFSAPSYTIVHPMPAQTALALAAGQSAQPLQQQPQHVRVPEPGVPGITQQQQYSKLALAEQSMVYVNPGFYCYPTASYTPYSGVINALQCHAASGHPAAVLMPLRPSFRPAEQQQQVLMPGTQPATQQQQPQPLYPSVSFPQQ